MAADAFTVNEKPAPLVIHIFFFSFFPPLPRAIKKGQQLLSDREKESSTEQTALRRGDNAPFRFSSTADAATKTRGLFLLSTFLLQSGNGVAPRIGKGKDE